jgi:hypothetical protein
MSTTSKDPSWVVYQMAIRINPKVLNAVCEQAEWDEMAALQPGYYTLIQAGILNEGEAERLARAGQPAAPPTQKVPIRSKQGA